MQKNPFLSKKSRKHSKMVESPLFSKTSSIDKNVILSQKMSAVKEQKLKDSGLMVLNSTEKNPIIFPSSLEKFVKNRKMTISPQQLSKMSMSKSKNVVSFDDRLNESNKKRFRNRAKSMSVIGQRSILRWDSYSFLNKKSVAKQELKNIKKAIKDKKLVKQLKQHNSSKILDAESNATAKSSTKDASQSQGLSKNTFREDIFGNPIIKGGRSHRVSFSYKGDMKLVENWKKLNKKMTIPADHSNVEIEEDKKKKCRIF